VASQAQVRGYLLEEVLAWLLRKNGYGLLTAPVSGDPALEMNGAGLAVRGRGARHQADVLGEFPFTPPFSLPIRMFVEAKSYQPKDPVGLGVVRNAWATVADVNEFDVGMSPYRYRYVYTLFSTSGFTDEAAEFALKHQISLVDLTLPKYDALRTGVEQAAFTVHPHVVGAGGVERFRRLVRHVLGTADVQLPRVIPGRQAMLDAIRRLQSDLDASFGGEFLLAFPPAPFVLALTGDIGQFLRHAAHQHDHQINILRDIDDSTATGWIIRPADGSDLAYTLRFSLPPYVEEWLMIDRRHARQLKQTNLATIMIYRMRDGVPQAYQLRYVPRPRTSGVR
jgi:hypothetical protein